MVREGEAVAKSQRTIWQRSTRTKRVRIFLAGKENETAWETSTGGLVATRLWPETGCCRSLSREVCATLDMTRRGVFEIVRAIGMPKARLDERTEFASEREKMRAVYRAKRNFIKLPAKLS